MDFQENIFSNAVGFFHELLKEFREYSRINFSSGMRSKIFSIGIRSGWPRLFRFKSARMGWLETARAHSG